MLDDLTGARARASRLPDHWGNRHDARLIEAGGRYAAIAALSDEWGIAEAVLLARWHRLRTGSGGPPNREAEDFEALRGAVTGAMFKICVALRRGTPLSSLQIAERCGIRQSEVVVHIRKNSSRLTGTGLWRLESGPAGGTPVYTLRHLGGAAS